MKRGFFASLLVCWPLVGKTETPEEWITLGARVHGAFGSFIPLGIKIGLDAVNRLNAKPRELNVLNSDGTASHARTDEVRMQLCIGTSIAIIVPTTIRSYLAHRE